MFLATATIERDPLPALSAEAYLAKYRAAIAEIGMAPETLSAS